jgi:N-acetylmuramoyl-L-alanine amidase
MNRFLALLVLAFFSLTVGICASQSGNPTASVWFNGREYVRFSEWAKPRGVKVAWLQRDETFQGVSSSFCFSARVDSSQARINGIELWLCFPVLARNGVIYLSRLDLNATLQPLLSTPRMRAGQKIKTICLDPGHGGKDPGFRVGSTEEQKHTLLLAQEMRQLLTQAGFKVTLTRTSDRFVDLPDRADWAWRKKADIFISLHYNATENSRSVQGSEVYCLTPAGAFSTNDGRGRGDSGVCPGNQSDSFNLLLAYHLQAALTHGLSVSDRGVRRARFAVLRETRMPAVLVEAGFLSHPAEGRRIIDPNYRRQVAKALVQGLQAYQKAVGG